MASHAFKTLFQGQLPSSVATQATVGAGKAWIVSAITLVNTDTSARTAGLFKNGTTAAFQIGTSTIALVANGGSYVDTTRRTFAAGDTLAGVASVATKINILVEGDEYTL